TPAGNYNGTDTFAYTVSDGHGADERATVTVSVNAVNDVPVAALDAATTAEDTSVTIPVLANDSDPDGDTLSDPKSTAPAMGTALANANSTISYTPHADFNGTDSFTYTISDGHGETATATVSVTTTPENDTPVAANDAAVTSEDTAVSIAVLANDSDPDGDAL